MNDVVNLRQARKAKRRAEAETTAAANRLRFGRHRQDRLGAALEAGRAGRVLDGARIEPAAEGAAPSRGGDTPVGDASG